MGIHVVTLELMYEAVKAAGITDLKGKWMMELGDQILRKDTRVKYNIETDCSKAYFLGLRCNHHSIDWNGFMGAVPLDMTKPIPIKNYMNRFDIITDFGCMEHICGADDIRKTTEPCYLHHWQAWKNIHDMGKVGCVYVHLLPLVESFPRHGAYHYNTDFFKKLCSANGYRHLILRTKRHDPRTWKRDKVHSAYVKESDDVFKPDVEEFKSWLYVRTAGRPEKTEYIHYV